MLLKFSMLILSCCAIVNSQFVQYWAVAGDCTKFLNCVPYGDCFIQECGPGTEFNPKIGVCDYPLADRSHCEIPVQQIPDNRHIHLYPVEGDCTLFLNCWSSEVEPTQCYIQQCGPGTEFDPRISSCGWPLADRSNCRQQNQLWN